MHLHLSKRTLAFTLWVLSCLINAMPLRAQEAKADNPQQTFAAYPSAVYMNFFLACPSVKPCTRTGNFRVDPVPKGCCMLTVANGDGRGGDEVSTYKVFLNGQRVLPPVKLEMRKRR